MVYSEEDVPFKFAVHLVNVECRDTRRTPSENQRLYASILTKVRKYSATKEEEWSPITQTVKGDVPIRQVNGWPRCFVRPIFRVCPTFKCITSRSCDRVSDRLAPHPQPSRMDGILKSHVTAKHNLTVHYL